MNAYTHAWRDSNRRTERGLPAHPDPSGFVDCLVCKGTGIHFGFCPSGEDDEPCDACHGEGIVRDGDRDPLIELHEARSGRDLESGHYAARYRAWRKYAMRPSLGLSQLHMVEAAIGCDLTARETVRIWRAA
jgi:hypothetical protein